MSGFREKAAAFNTSFPVGGPVVVGVFAFLAGLAADKTWDAATLPNASKWWIAPFIVLVGFVVFAAWVTAVGTHFNRLAQGRDQKLGVIKELLAALGKVVRGGDESKHVRVCIMETFEDPRKGLRRKVQTATAFNMDDDPDRDLDIAYKAGVSGRAAEKKKLAAAKLVGQEKESNPHQGMFDDEIAKVRADLTVILSVPIVDPDKPTGNVLGTLQIDTTETLARVPLNQVRIHQISQVFAGVLSVVLR